MIVFGDDLRSRCQMTINVKVSCELTFPVELKILQFDPTLNIFFFKIQSDILETKPDTKILIHVLQYDT